MDVWMQQVEPLQLMEHGQHPHVLLVISLPAVLALAHLAPKTRISYIKFILCCIICFVI